MEISPLPTRWPAADLPLERLTSSRRLSEPEKLAAVSREFEAILVRQILAAAGTPASASASAGIYQDMINDHLAESISRSGALGLAGSLAGQLGREIHPPPAEQPPSSAL